MHEHISQRITAVINTLNAATVRVDQIDAIQRINACTKELCDLIAYIKSDSQEPEE